MTQLEWRSDHVTLLCKTFGFASHSLETQECLQWLPSPWMGSPLLLWLHFLQLSIPTLLPCWPPPCSFCTLPPQNFFSSCFIPQMLPGPPPITFLTQISPCQWVFHDHPFKLHSLHTCLFFSFPAQSFSITVITIMLIVHLIKLSYFFGLPSLGLSSIQARVFVRFTPCCISAPRTEPGTHECSRNIRGMNEWGN